MLYILQFLRRFAFTSLCVFPLLGLCIIELFHEFVRGFHAPSPRFVLTSCKGQLAVIEIEQCFVERIALFFAAFACIARPAYLFLAAGRAMRRYTSWPVSKSYTGPLAS